MKKKKQRKLLEKPKKDIKPQLVKYNWYGFDEEKVNKVFSGGLTYVGDICVNHEYHPVSVYKVEKPNKAKGHKEYLLLQANSNGGIVRGMSTRQISKYRYQEAVHCLECNKVIYSVNRHHYITCGCKNEAMADGGKDYLKYSALDTNKIRVVIVDIFTGRIKNK